MYCYNLITRSSQFCDYAGLVMEHSGFARYQLLELIMAVTIPAFEPFLLKVLENLKNRKPMGYLANVSLGF